MRNGRGVEYSLLTIPAEEFPATPCSVTASFRVEATALQSALKRVSPAMSSDPTRGILNGVCFEVHGKQLTIIATDGRRLATQELVISQGPGSAPRSFCQRWREQLIKLLDTGVVWTSVGGDHAEFCFQSQQKNNDPLTLKLVSKLIEARTQLAAGGAYRLEV